MTPDLIVQVLRSTFAQGIDSSLRDYVRWHRTRRWLLFSDYVLGQANRHNDTFAFTLVPAGRHLEIIGRDIRRLSDRDLKDCSKVSPSMMQLLQDHRIMTFCFLVPRKRSQQVEDARAAIAATLAMTKEWRNRGVALPMIKRLEEMRRQALSRSFNVRLLDDMIFASTFAAYLTAQLCRFGPTERVGWFSDVDKITTAFGGFVNDMYAANVRGLCQQLVPGWQGPALGVNQIPLPGERLWCEQHLRIPDHFAGVMAAWNLRTNEIPSASPKYLPVLAEAIADRKNVHLIKIARATLPEGGEHMEASRLLVSRTPIAGAAK